MPGRVVVTDVRVREALLGETGPATIYVTRLGRRAVNSAKTFCPVDTGRLRASIDSTVSRTARSVIATVGSGVRYAAPVHEGYTQRRGRSTITVGGRPFIIQGVEAATGVPVIRRA